MTRFQKQLYLILVLFTLCFVGLVYHSRVLFCLTESLKGVRGVFVWKGLSYQNGDIIFLRGHEVAYHGTIPLAKRILGLPGDTIFHQKNALIVAGKTLPLLEMTKKGNPLTPLKVLTIPKGYAFVVGEDERSFDSRYEEFGLVPQEKVWGRAVFSW